MALLGYIVSSVSDMPDKSVKFGKLISNVTPFRTFPCSKQIEVRKAILKHFFKMAVTQISVFVYFRSPIILGKVSK